MTKAIEQMQNDSDPEMGGAVLLSVTIRLLIDPENMLTTTSAAGAPTVRTEKTEFLNYLYSHCMQTLLSPIAKLSKDFPSNTAGESKWPGGSVRFLQYVLSQFCCRI